ncbi:Polysaccharide biosynthesis/export protein [Posidoniimonas corsicana]|uniref:Polysaccharide biosynthesis/export protein n=1 Tax=Posidoniimonas corsicana TaxID=1938618 RepID=A0A5C5VHA7_9BACT|nr:polysaccharide biosynthesis/export family protein [Posidoniimonas corsicana]TWT37357.1 Polysaccharide biosynthesis/export protein [Posidoniimonas corsicana]
MNHTCSTHKPLIALAALMLSGSMGCTAFNAPREPIPVAPPDPPPTAPAPRELAMTTLERYVIEPPDVLMINAIKIVPKPPHKIEPFDGLLIRVVNALPGQEIGDAFAVSPEGTVDLGPTYGKVKVVGLRIDEAQDAIRDHLTKVLEDPQVSVSLAFSSGAQQIVGEHLVAPDGRVNLGTYGSVYVTGLTLDQAKEAIEAKLSDKLENPEVVVDVFAYNSKRYFIITQGAGFGDNIVQQPVTGNETVLDALARIGGISQISSTKIWIARPAPNGVGCEQILPVNYEDVVQGVTATNYQLLPGDRLFIAEDPMTKFDAIVSKITRPFERIFGFVALGTSTANRIERFGLGNLN